MINLNDKLDTAQQKEILGYIGFWIDEDKVIYDDDGNEFYRFNENDKWDLATLKGILDYVKHLGENNGKWILRSDIKNVLGL